MGNEAVETEVSKKVETPEADKSLELLKYDMSRVGPNENKGQIYPIDLLNKHENLLKSDINALSEMLINLQKCRFWTQEILIRISKICELHLNKPNGLENAAKIAQAIAILRRNDLGGSIELNETGKKRKKDATPSVIPPSLMEFVDKLEKGVEGAFEKLLKKNKEINEDEFLKLSENLYSDSTAVREKTLQYLLSVKKKPAENIATFQQIIKRLLVSYEVSKSPDILDLMNKTLENGKNLMEQDQETKEKINKMITETLHRIIKGLITAYEKFKHPEAINDIEVILEKNKDLFEKDLETKEKIDKMIRGAKIDKLIAEVKERKMEEEKERKMAEDEKNKINEIFKEHMEDIEKLANDKKYEEALDKISNAFKIIGPSPKLLEFYDNCVAGITDKGLEFKERGEYDKAIACFTFILKRFPTLQGAIENLTVCSFLKGQKELKTLEGPPDPTKPVAKKSELSEENVRGDIKTAMDNIARGETDIAKLILEELNKKIPDNPGIIHCLSICHMVEAQKLMEEVNGSIKNAEDLEKRENMLKFMPLLTKFLVEMGESLKLQKHLVDKGIGKDFMNESQIFASFTDALKLCKTISGPYVAKIEKWVENPDSTLSAGEKVVFADFAKAEADLIASYYPERKFSMWDLINVATVNENKKRLLEDAEGIPVKIDTVARIDIGIEKVNAEDILEIIISITGDKAFINASKELKGILHVYKKEGHMSPDYGMAFIRFKNNLTRLMLKGGNKEKFDKIALDILPFMESEEKFLQLVNLKSEKPEKSKLPNKRWGEKSIDPKIEMGFNMDALNFYLMAIKVDPDNMENYEALFGFLDKIQFEQGKGELPDAKKPQEEHYEFSDFFNRLSPEYILKNPDLSLQLFEKIASDEGYTENEELLDELKYLKQMLKAENINENLKKYPKLMASFISHTDKIKGLLKGGERQKILDSVTRLQEERKPQKEHDKFSDFFDKLSPEYIIKNPIRSLRMFKKIAREGYTGNGKLTDELENFIEILESGHLDEKLKSGAIKMETIIYHTNRIKELLEEGERKKILDLIKGRMLPEGMEQIAAYRKKFEDFKSKNIKDASEFVQNISLDYLSNKEVPDFLNKVSFDYFSKDPKAGIEILKAIEDLEAPDDYETRELAKDIRWYLEKAPIKDLMTMYALETMLGNKDLSDSVGELKKVLRKKPVDQEKLKSAESETNEIIERIMGEKIKDLRKILEETKFPEKIKNKKIEILEAVRAVAEESPDYKTYGSADDIIWYMGKTPIKDFETLDKLAIRLKNGEMRKSVEKLKEIARTKPVNKDKFNSAGDEVNRIMEMIMSEKIEALRKMIDEKTLAQKLEEKRSGKLSGELRDNTLNKIKLQTSLMSPESTKVEQEKAKQLKVSGDDISISFQPTLDKGSDLGGVMLNISINLDAIPALFKKLFGKK